MTPFLLSALFAGDCTLATPDSAWIASSLESWKRVAVHAGVVVRDVPDMILFDQQCTHIITVRRSRADGKRVSAIGRSFRVESVVHGDSITLLDGTHMPVTLTSFASPKPDGSMAFVMSLPAIWRASGRGPNADALASAVFMHEFTHTQTRGLGRRIDALVKRGLPEASDDDVIQTRFGERPDFARDFAMERDALFAAVDATARAERVQRGAVAMRMIDRRRATSFKGADAIYADAEDVFLSLEGMGQWMAYRWLIDPKGGKMLPSDALPFIRRGGRRWSQDEGLALLLLLEQLSPSAPKSLFADRPTTVLPLLRRALTSR